MGSGGSLLSFVGRRLLITIPLLLLISFAVFSLVLIIPGNPALTLAGGTHAKPAEVARISQQLHLNEPFWTPVPALAERGAPRQPGQLPVPAPERGLGDRRDQFPVTLSLAVGGMLVAVLIGLPAGIVSGVRQGTAPDRLVTVGSSLGVAIPDFWLAMLLVIVFAVNPHCAAGPWLHALRHLTLAVVRAPDPAVAGPRDRRRGHHRPPDPRLADRHARPGLHADGAGQGSGHRAVIGKHALKNALSPAVTVIGIQFGYLLGGTFIIEQIFSLPGIGQYMLQAISEKDLPVIQGVVLVTAVCFVIINLSSTSSTPTSTRRSGWHEPGHPPGQRGPLRRPGGPAAARGRHRHPRLPATAHGGRFWQPLPPPARSPWRAWPSCVIVILAAIFAPLLAPYGPNVQDLHAINAGPSSAALAGHRRPRPRHPEPAHLGCPDLPARHLRDRRRSPLVIAIPLGPGRRLLPGRGRHA